MIDEKVDRKKSIGGSDIGIILGYSHFKTAEQLFLEKCGFVESDFKTNKYIEYGNMMEPIIVSLFEEEFDVKILQPGVIYGEKEYYTANVDGIVIDKKNRQKYILEIKTASLFSYERNFNQNKIGVPINYYYQVLWYQFITGINSIPAKLIVYLNSDEGEYHIYDIHYDHKRIASILPTIDKFWEAVKNKDWNIFKNQIRV
jgi:putative phage-type endonuclease